MVDGFLSMNWDVKKFHLPDDANTVKKIFTWIELLNENNFETKMNSDAYDKVLIVYNAETLNEYTNALV